jgi:hypothetical protein
MKSPFDRLDNELLNDSCAASSNDSVEQALSSASMASLLPANPTAKQQKERKSQSTLLVELAQGVKLFHDKDKVGYGQINIDGHYETLCLRSKPFRDWLRYIFYVSYQKPPGSQAVEDAIATLNAKAQFESPEAAVFKRIAHLNGNIYLDLCNPTWQCIEITPIGWSIQDKPSVYFIRERAVEALPIPERGGSLNLLWDLLNVQSHESQVLLAGWLLFAFRHKGPYPLLLLEGEQGTSKSTTSKALRSLIDPSSVPLRSAPRSEQDLLIAAKNSWLLSYDNLSGLPSWLSDAFCRLASGGGFATRELYSDTNETLLQAQCPILLNGIDDIATRSDLMDRALVIQLEPIPDNRRLTEEAFWQNFDSQKPLILGALLDALSGILHQLPSTPPPPLPRMADFAHWVTAAESSLGWQPYTFVNTYRLYTKKAIESHVDASPLATAIISLMDNFPRWVGTAMECLQKLDSFIPERLRFSRTWPQSARSLTNGLRRLATALRASGIDIRFYHSGKRYIRIEKCDPNTVAEDTKVISPTVLASTSKEATTHSHASSVYLASDASQMVSQQQVDISAIKPSAATQNNISLDTTQAQVLKQTSNSPLTTGRFTYVIE